MIIIDALLMSALVATAATGLTVILRHAPIIRGWVFEMKKPWACNVCMPLYTCAVVLSTLVWKNPQPIHAVVALAAYTLSHVFLEAMSRPPPEGPPSFTDEEMGFPSVDATAEVAVETLRPPPLPAA